MRVLGAFFVVLSAAIPAAAQNFVINSDFDSDLSGWTDATAADGSVAQTSAEDSDGNAPASGAVFATLTRDSGGGCATLLTQCQFVSSSTNYDVFVDIYQPSAQLPNGFGRLFVQEHNNATCSDFNGVIHSTTTVTDGSWQTTPTESFTTLVTTQSVLIGLCITSDSATDPFVAYFDDVVFGLQGVPVELMGMSVE